jgi:hypothetical protein
MPEVDMDEPEVSPHRRFDDTGGRHRLFRFVPDISMGTVMQMLLLVVMAGGAYGTYQADKAKDHAEVAQIKVDAEQQRTTVKETLSELKGDVKNIQSTLGEVKESLAVLKARDPQKERK